MDPKQAPCSPETNPEILRAFRLMWDSFPSPAALLRKDRTVLACNPAAVAIGYREGARCFQTFGDKGVHKHCRANEALRDGVAQRSVVYNVAKQAVGDSYWVPVPGEKDLFVHTVINITQYAKPELFQE
jgi:hypothetical protein